MARAHNQGERHVRRGRARHAAGGLGGTADNVLILDNGHFLTDDSGNYLEAA